MKNIFNLKFFGGSYNTYLQKYLTKANFKYLLYFIISILFIIYLFYGYLIVFSLSFYFSLSILQFIGNNYKFSEYFIFRISQKFLVYGTVVLLGLYFLFILSLFCSSFLT